MTFHCYHGYTWNKVRNKGDIWNKGGIIQRRKSTGIHMLRNKQSKRQVQQNVKVPRYENRSRHKLYSKCCLFYSLAAVLILYLAYIFYNPDRYLNKVRKDTLKLAKEPSDSNMAVPAWAVAVIVFAALLLTACVAFLFCCCWMLRRRREQQVLHRSSMPPGGAAYYGGGMPGSEFGQTRATYPRIWSNTYKYKMNQAPRMHYQPRQQHIHLHRHAPQRNGSYVTEPTVIIYETDKKMRSPSTSSAPRFYYHNEAEDVTEENSKREDRDAYSPTDTEPQTSNEPIVEFPDDDDDEEQTKGDS